MSHFGAVVSFLAVCAVGASVAFRGGGGVLAWWGCPFRWLSGWPCPFCGISRATACLFTGDWAGAVRFQPMVLVLLVFSGGMAGWALWGLVVGRPVVLGPRFSKVLLAVGVLTWVLKLATPPEFW